MAQQASACSLVQDLLTLSRLEGSPLPARNDWTSAPLLRRCENEARALSNGDAQAGKPMC
jgi:two-component system phosphate regulon sensor histidine kinase PhoR